MILHLYNNVTKEMLCQVLPCNSYCHRNNVMFIFCFFHAMIHFSRMSFEEHDVKCFWFHVRSAFTQWFALFKSNMLLFYFVQIVMFKLITEIQREFAIKIFEGVCVWSCDLRSDISLLFCSYYYIIISLCRHQIQDVRSFHSCWSACYNISW